MTADELLGDSAGKRAARDIDEVLASWERRGQCPGDDAMGMATMLAVLGADAAVGDGLLNEISPGLQASMERLMGEKADTYDEAHKLIQESLAKGDQSFAGFVSKIKGQIGEDHFVREYPDYVLATSKSQEAVDALAYLPDGSLAAAQVKMYSDAGAVIRHMLEVRAKVDHGLLVEGNSVAQLNFAVPADIADQVRVKMAGYPELANIHVLPIRASADEAADVVREAGDNLAHPFSHLGEQVLQSVATMAALDALANAYLVAKGKKSIADVVHEAAIKTPIGAVAITTSKFVAMALSKTGAAANPIVIPILVAIATRRLSRKWLDGRSEFAGRLRDDAEWTTLLTTALENAGKGKPRPA